jgi:hypothetical protein
MKPLTKVRMIRSPKRWSGESFGMTSNTWDIGDLGYIEAVITINSRLLLVIVLGNKIISCYTDAVEVIKD